MSLALPISQRPRNLHLSEQTKVSLVESDLYNICNRIAEISDKLFILELEDDSAHAFAIMEYCQDGQERLVYKVRDLDARVVERLRYLMAKPLNERIDILEKEAHRMEAEQKEEDFDELYQRLGRPMWSQLEKSGFIQRPISYPARGIKYGNR